MATCSVIKCTGDAAKRGYCSAHYQRMRKDGSLPTIRQPRTSGQPYHMWWLKSQLRKFGATLEDYHYLLTKQQGRCAICNRTPDHQARKGRLCIDHDHDTNTMRGLLCDHCNRGLGIFQDSPELLAKAQMYLAQYKSPT